MKTDVTLANLQQTTVARLREATRELHLELHEHPLLVELLTRPSDDSYRAVLEGFLRFYQSTEPAVVECSHRLDVAEQYLRVDRTVWLSADLKILNSGRQRIEPLEKGQAVAPLSGIGELAGCLYVIRGSSLGGRTILRELNRSLHVNRCCRFFTGDGDRTTQIWQDFQQFCNSACRCEEVRQAAIGAARSAFLSVEECMTWSMKRSHS
jgi:heme oxygenase